MTLAAPAVKAQPAPPFTQWASAFADGLTLTAAMLGHLLHHAHIVQVTGESYRLKDKRRWRGGSEKAAGGMNGGGDVDDALTRTGAARGQHFAFTAACYDVEQK